LPAATVNMSTDCDSLEQRVLILAPTGKDGPLAETALDRVGIASCCCRDLEQLCLELYVGAGAVLIAEEALATDRAQDLSRWLSLQPPWSDLPVLILTLPNATSESISRATAALGNVTVVERPTRIAALVTAVQSALRARERQYQIREYLVERERNVQAQTLLAAIVSSSDDAIISKTLDGNILSWNAGAERLFGYSESEVLGKPILMLLPTDRYDEETEILRKLHAGERIEHFETVRVTKDGRRIDISITVSPIRDADGNIVGASKVARDITERKHAEAALKEAARRKDEFLAILAHELRNPLAPIRNSLHLLRLTRSEDESMQKIGDMLERQVGHMVRLVDDLLEVSRITRGKIELRKEQVDVSSVLSSAVETSQPIVDAAGHELAVSIPPESLVLDGDPVRLSQVLANLINNAAKYTDRNGHIWVNVRRDGNDVLISVKDDGTGILADRLPHVFELFTQVDQERSRSQGGLGIGLALVKSLVEMHGGSVQAQSAGRSMGSEFTVRLPLAAEAELNSSANVGKPSNDALVRRRILVVDDNRDAAEIMGMLLKVLGADVEKAFGGEEALAKMDTFQPNVVLMDIGMPEMDGYEVARRIRKNADFAHVTLIALTGWGQDEDRRRTQEAGFDYHLTKPADAGALQSLLNSLGEKD
jgi:PAS domain S-box-containing protein